MATHLATAFKEVGCQICHVWSRNCAHAQTLARKVGAETVADIRQIGRDDDFVFVAVSDDSLTEVIAQLRLSRAILVHTSGATSIDVLGMSASRYGVVWSPQSFVRDVPMDYTQLPLCAEGNNDATTRQLVELLGRVSKKTYVLNGNQRLWAHLSAVLVNNFGNYINALAQQLMSRQEIPFELLHPIIQTTANRAVSAAPNQNLFDFQTGPAIRRDEKTLSRHRSLIADEEEILQLYDLMTQAIQSFQDEKR